MRTFRPQRHVSFQAARIVQQHQHHHHQQHHRRARAAAAGATSGAASAAAAPSDGPALPGGGGAASYHWSWDGGAALAERGASAFDAAHPLPAGGGVSAEALGALLQAAADSAEPPSAAWLSELCAKAAPALSAGLSAEAACALLRQLAAIGWWPPATASSSGGSDWQAAVLAPLAAAAESDALPTAQLADALWSLSNLPGIGSAAAAAAAHTSGDGSSGSRSSSSSSSSSSSGGDDDAAAAAAAAAQQRRERQDAAAAALLAAVARRLPDFFGPDLARAVCAAGTLAAADAGVVTPGGAGSGAGGSASSGSSGTVAAARLGVDAAWTRAVLGEAEYQLVEFPADLSAFDLARLALGLALLAEAGAAASLAAGAGAGAEPWPEPSARLREALLKAVYGRTRAIEEKAAVDYALARLDARGKRSMHYDPRWTHEELKWLPRRERDKRRILKDGWYRTQWQGWRADG